MFSGKSVLVTAGAAGIGACIARAFSEQGAGVHLVDIDEAALNASVEKNTGYLTTAADVATESDVETVFARHIEKFGNLYVLVNCAGIAGPTALTEDIELSEWQRCFAVNMNGTFLMTREAVPHMKTARSGRIINISSTAGWHGYPMRSPYASAKWAVIGFTKSLAMELGQYGVTANVICPGSIDGERMDRVIAAEAQEKGITEKEIRKNYARSCSMRTFISGDDIADMAVFLASEGAKRVTGQIMNVDGNLENFAGLDDLELGDFADDNGERS